MDDNIELLNFIYQNSQMGVTTLKQLLPLVEDQELKKHLEKQRDGYLHFHQEAKELLHQAGYDEKGIDAFEKIRTYLMINMQTLMDKSTQHLSKMVLIGSNMGVIEAIAKRHRFTKAKSNVVSIMKELELFEKRNMEELENFL